MIQAIVWSLSRTGKVMQFPETALAAPAAQEAAVRFEGAWPFCHVPDAGAGDAAAAAGSGALAYASESWR